MVRVAEAEQSVEPTPEESLTQRVRAFVRLKATIKSLTDQANGLKKDLNEYVSSQGETDEAGNEWYNLPSEVDGIAALKRERRVSQALDIDAAEEILRERGLYDRCVEQRPVLNEDEVMACITEELLDENEIARMYPQTVSYAFVPQKKGY